MSIRDFVIRACARIWRIIKQAWLEATSPRIVSAQTLSERAFLDKFELEEAPVTKKALLDRYGHRVAHTWPAPPSVIRDMRVNIDELSKEDILALADSVLEHRFVLRLNAPQITPEGMIAWHLSPTFDREWLWAL